MSATTVEEPAKRFTGFNVKKTVNGETALARLREMQKREAEIFPKTREKLENLFLHGDV